MTELNPLETDFARRYPDRFAKSLVDLEMVELVEVLAQLQVDLAMGVAAELPYQQLLAAAKDIVQPERLEEATTDAGIAVLNRLPRELARSLVQRIDDRRERNRYLQFLNYPAHCVGAIVRRVTVFCATSDTVGHVSELTSSEGSAGEPTVVVVDDQERYVGVVETWRLLHSESNVLVAELVNRVAPLSAESARANANSSSIWGNRAWLPVIDHVRRVVGVCWRAGLAGGEEGAVVSESIRTFDGLLAAAVSLLKALLDGILVKRRT